MSLFWIDSESILNQIKIKNWLSKTRWLDNRIKIRGRMGNEQLENCFWFPLFSPTFVLSGTAQKTPLGWEWLLPSYELTWAFKHGKVPILLCVLLSRRRDYRNIDRNGKKIIFGQWHNKGARDPPAYNIMVPLHMELGDFNILKVLKINIKYIMTSSHQNIQH